MTRNAQLAQFPTLVRLHEGQAMFRDGEQLTITMTTEAWKALGRPVDLQIIATPIEQDAAAVGRVLIARGELVDDDAAALLDSRRQVAQSMADDAQAAYDAEDEQ